MQIRTIHKLDRGLAYAEACFETFRVIEGNVFDWPGHWSRLILGLSEFGILLPQGLDEEVLFACLAKAAKTSPDALIRLSISGGESAWGLFSKAAEAAIYIQCLPYVSYSSAVHLKLRTWPFPIKKKTAKFTADYSETLRALGGEEAVSVLFERDNQLLATATANLLLYREGQWYTPIADAGVLPGRVRHYLLQQGLIHERACPSHWLADCEAMAVCNSGVFIQPVGSIEAVASAISASLWQCVQRSSPLSVDHAALGLLLQPLLEQKGVR